MLPSFLSPSCNLNLGAEEKLTRGVVPAAFWLSFGSDRVLGAGKGQTANGFVLAVSWLLAGSDRIIVEQVGTIGVFAIVARLPPSDCGSLQEADEVPVKQCTFISFYINNSSNSNHLQASCSWLSGHLPVVLRSSVRAKA